MRMEESVCLLGVIFSCLLCSSSGFTLRADDEDELVKFSEQQADRTPTNIRLTFNQRHKLLLQNAHMDDMIKDPVHFEIPNRDSARPLRTDPLNGQDLKTIVDKIVECKFDDNCIKAIQEYRSGEDEDDDDDCDLTENKDSEKCGGDSQESIDSDSQDFDPWTLVWYIGSFGGLIVFFLMVSCSEWCCKKYHQGCPETLASANANNQSIRSAAPTERDTPPPGYHLFAPPDYDHAKEKEQFDVYVVPTHTVNQVLVNQIRCMSGSGAAIAEEGEEPATKVIVHATAPSEDDLPPSYSSLALETVGEQHKEIVSSESGKETSKYPGHVVQCS